MDSTTLLVALPIATFAVVIGFALWNKKRVEDRGDDPSAPKSTLAADAPDSR